MNQFGKCTFCDYRFYSSLYPYPDAYYYEMDTTPMSLYIFGHFNKDVQQELILIAD